MVARASMLRLTVLASLLGGLLAPLGLASPGADAALAAPLDDATTTLVVIDTPRGGTSSSQLYVAGWAADPSSTSGTGVDRVDVYLDGEPGTGTLLGRATYGLARPDIAAHLGSSRFALSGYALQASVSAGPHTIYVYAHPSDQPADQGWSQPKTAAVMVSASAAVAGAPVAVAGAPPVVVAEGPPPLSGVTSRLTGITGSYTLGAIPPTGSNYPPGPADTGGPIYQPVYLGWGLYGAPLPFPDYPPYYWWSSYNNPYSWYGGGYYTPTGYAVPSGFDFSLGMGANWFSTDYFWGPGLWRGGRWLGGPLYCPVYTYAFC